MSNPAEREETLRDAYRERRTHDTRPPSQGSALAAGLAALFIAAIIGAVLILSSCDGDAPVKPLGWIEQDFHDKKYHCRDGGNNTAMTWYFNSDGTGYHYVYRNAGDRRFTWTFVRGDAWITPALGEQYWFQDYDHFNCVQEEIN